MWRFVGDKKGLEPLPGLPLEAPDEEFEEAVKRFEAQFGDRSFPDPEHPNKTLTLKAKGSVERSGLYEHVADTPKERASSPSKSQEEG